MALAYQKQLDAQTAFAIWKIEETAPELVEQLQLKEHETAYLETLNNGKRNLHWLSTRVLLRKMLNTDEYIDCQADEHGKPYLVNFPHYISLSHSFDYAAVMISKDKAVGIDIELIKDKITRIASRFMSPGELGFIDEQQPINHLYSCWCAKEAVYKLYGKTKVSFRNDIHIHPFDFSAEGSFDVSLTSGNIHRNYTVHYERFLEYMIGYVAE